MNDEPQMDIDTAMATPLWHELAQENARLRVECHRLRRELADRETLLAAAPSLVVLCDLDGRVVALNRLPPGAVEGGGEVASAIGRALVELLPASARAEAGATLAVTAATGQPGQFVCTWREGGDAPTHRARVELKETASGVKGLVVVCGVDCHERIAAAVLERETHLRSVFEAAGGGIWSWHVERASGEGDARVYEIFGLPSAAQGGRITTDVVHADDRRRVEIALGAAARTGRYGPIEHRIVTPAQEVRWVRAVGATRVERDGTTTILGGLRDITDERAHVAQSSQSHTLESIGRLAGGVAHDFNNLLTVIMGAVDLAWLGLEPGTTMGGELEQIRAASQRAAQLTGQLLAFARRQVVNPRVIDANELVLGVGRLLRRVLGEDVAFATEARSKGRILIDAHQLERVLLNLASNARDAMPMGGSMTIRTDDVTIVADPVTPHPELTPGPHVRITVEDTGTGIAPDVLPHVFEPFFTTKDERGVGLGLATCYGVVRQAGGSIQVTSQLGRGTTFRILLPAVDLPLAVAPSPPVRVAPPGGNEHILVVEDDASVRRVVVRTLARLGYGVREAGGIDEALSIAKSRVPLDLVLSDVVLPGLGGREVIDHIRLLRPGVAVLFMSGHTAHAVARHGVDEDVDFLSKPFTPETLDQRVRQALARRPHPKAADPH